MNNRMDITQKVLDKQVDIIENAEIPEKLKQSDQLVYGHLANSESSTEEFLNDGETIDAMHTESIMPEYVSDIKKRLL